MRRKSERTASKKTKSPEKKIEKVKRTRTRRRKQSTSSENESGEEVAPVPPVETVSEVEKKPPGTPVKEDSPEEAHDQVWHVKATEASGDVGEIQKLKICLTRPPSTPERVDRSPRSKRKHSRATSSSDTPSNEGEERKKSKHRSKRATRESKDDSEKNQDSQEEPEADTESHRSKEKSDNEISQSSDKKSDSIPDDTPMSTTNEEAKSSDKIEQSTESSDSKEKSEIETAETSKTSDADTTVASPKVETTVVSTDNETTDDKANKSSEEQSAEHKDAAEDKSEVLELHDDDNRCESSDTEVSKSQNESSKQDQKPDCTEKADQAEDSKKETKPEKTEKESKTKESKQENRSTETPEKRKTESMDQDKDFSVDEVSKTEDNKSDNISEEKPCDSNESNKPDESHVVESSEKNDYKVRKDETSKDVEEPSESRRMERSNSTHSQNEENVQNGSSAPIVINRKRRWGSRPTKLQTQKSITISTDVLKDIIPDVKPVEFDEVIEDKKSKREVTEKIERPVLPKIVIDNTESIEMNKKIAEEKEREVVRPRDSQLASSRKISIVKENDSIITRPPSPPRNKQSCILFITNLVRPFTLPQLKNLLQRTGRIAEDGFWIDKIKSKCYVKYESEDQAVETRHALHGVTWPVSNPKTLQVDFSNDEAFDKAKLNEDTDNAQVSTIPGTVEDWLREQDIKRERGEMEKPFERKAVMREWDVGKNDKDKDKIRRHDERPIGGLDKRRHRSPERSPEPARKFKKKEEEAPAKLLDDLFRKTKTTPCIYWLPLSAETIAVKEEQRRQHMAEHERRLQELRRTHRRH